MKPIHPAAVHFPIAFLSLSFLLDFTHHFRASLPTALTSSLPPAAADLTRASYALLTLGLLSAIPALVTGVREAVVLIAKQGMYETDASGYKITMRTKVKALIAHAVANDLVLGLTTLVWYKKRAAAAAADATIAGKLGVSGAAVYEPALWMLALEGVLFAGLMMAANIGSSLTYIFGVGFSAGGASAGKKKA